MRFERLDLAPYGRFADRSLVFSPDAALHVVLGRNEAGKTTTLEAIKDYLFRIETRTPFAFEHAYDALRIGASIRFADGSRFEARRRKGNVNTLVDADNKPVSEEPLLNALGGLKREAFEAEFGLSQHTLRAGGAALLAAGGKLAETLAAGSAGLGALVRLREQLDKQADALFTPRRAKDKEFYRALDDYDAADKSLRDAVVTADALKKADQRRADALSSEDRLREDHEDAGRRLSLRERAARTRETLARLDAIARELADYADLPEIDAGRLAAWRKALEEDRVLAATLAELSAEAETQTQEIASRVVDRALLEDGPAIETLREKLSEIRKAADDLPRRIEARTQALHQLDDLARRLGLADHRALLASPPGDAEIAVAQRALKARNEATRRRDEARERAEDARRKAEALDRAAPPAAADPEPLRRRLDALAERVADAERLKRERAALDRQTRELAEAAARLDPPVAELDALARAPLPAASDVAAFAKTEQARAKDRDLAAAELEKAERALAASEAARASREREAAGATRADWLAAREARDRALDHLGATLDADPQARRLAFDQTRALALAADAVGDRFVEDVERAARLQAAREDCAARREEVAGAAGRMQKLAAEREATQADWRKLWARSGFAPLGPAAMLRWLEQAEVLLTRRRELAARRDEVDALRARVAEAEASLTEAGFPAATGFETAYREARAELTARQTAYDAAAKATQARLQAVTAAEEAAAEFAAREAALAALASDWRPAMTALRLPETAAPEAAEAALAAWAAVAAPRTLMERETRSVEGIERDLADFAREASDLAARLAPDLAEAKPETTVARLVERLADARRIAAERTQLEKSAETRAARRRAEDAKRHALAPMLAAAREHFAAADDGRLALALERCEKRRDLEAERAQSQRQLVQAGDGLAEAELRAEQQGLDALALPDEIAALKRRREELDAARREAARAARDAEADYEALARGRDAAEAARRRTEAAGDLADIAERWLLRAAAARLAQRAIERHRNAAQDPLIARAGELFALATAGSFSGLGVGYDEAEPTLIARRPGGGTVPVKGLSEGARDQLYLSLRLALLERRAGEPLPFVGDDLLASFDDTRTAQALAMLAEFGSRRQTILFTHHARVAELARAVPGAELIDMET